jgi:ribosome-associated protein
LNRSSEAAKSPESLGILNDIIIDSIQDIKGKNIVKIDLRGLDDAPTNFFIVCEGESNTQIKSIADRVHQRVKKELFTHPSHMEGQQSAKWICIDYFDTVVHVFYPETREFYDLEELWSDGDFTEYHSL